MKTTYIIAAAAALSIALSACSGKSHEASSPEADQQRTELYDAMNSGDIKRIETVADSLSLMTDELSTDETVAVLLAFLQVHNDAAARKDTKKDLITIRKFVDVYDIAIGRGGDELISAFNSAKALNGNLDLPDIARQMRERLADYDAASGDESTEADTAAPKEEEAKPDTTVAAPADQPVNPAE